MWRNKKHSIISCLVSLSVIVIVLVGQGCSKGEDNGENQTEEEAQIVESATKAEENNTGQTEAEDW